ncbi:hypothetical protein KP509_07G097500 [Ceratopteris richardii]|uniref:Uncharacterized protein n=1 Tax=Ceratopteris richardii TaxID=49495 RepID=A0A8T2UKN1_CERRI|nr:hypothetical protein KP509_07G097500 [Ceratopteris richardii]
MSIVTLNHLICSINSQGKWLLATISLLFSLPALLPLICFLSFAFMLLLPLAGCALVGFLSWHRLCRQKSGSASSAPLSLLSSRNEKLQGKSLHLLLVKSGFVHFLLPFVIVSQLAKFVEWRETSVAYKVSDGDESDSDTVDMACHGASTLSMGEIDGVECRGRDDEIDNVCMWYNPLANMFDSEGDNTDSAISDQDGDNESEVWDCEYFSSGTSATNGSYEDRQGSMANVPHAIKRSPIIDESVERGITTISSSPEIVDFGPPSELDEMLAFSELESAKDSQHQMLTISKLESAMDSQDQNDYLSDLFNMDDSDDSFICNVDDETALFAEVQLEMEEYDAMLRMHGWDRPHSHRHLDCSIATGRNLLMEYSSQEDVSSDGCCTQELESPAGRSKEASVSSPLSTGSDWKSVSSTMSSSTSCTSGWSVWNKCPKIEHKAWQSNNSYEKGNALKGRRMNPIMPSQNGTNRERLASRKLLEGVQRASGCAEDTEAKRNGVSSSRVGRTAAVHADGAAKVWRAASSRCSELHRTNGVERREEEDFSAAAARKERWTVEDGRSAAARGSSSDMSGRRRRPQKSTSEAKITALSAYNDKKSPPTAVRRWFGGGCKSLSIEPSVANRRVVSGALRSSATAAHRADHAGMKSHVKEKKQLTPTMSDSATAVADAVSTGQPSTQYAGPGRPLRMPMTIDSRENRGTSVSRRAGPSTPHRTYSQLLDFWRGQELT